MSEKCQALFFLFFVQTTYLCTKKERYDDTPIYSISYFACRLRDILYGVAWQRDYEVRYPSFFEQLPDSLIDEPGFSQFRYWDNWVQIELTTRVIPNKDSLSTQEGMKRFAQLHHAKEQVMQDDSFMLSGPLYINGSEILNYRYHSKFVRHRRFWFVQMLVYPINCERAVRRLIQQVDD